MTFLCYYDEFYPGEGYPSIKPLLNGGPYPGQKEVLKYMDSLTPFLVSTKIPNDIITGEPGVGGISYFDDGRYGWTSELAYYVEKYNFKLPQDFIDYAFSKISH